MADFLLSGNAGIADGIYQYVNEYMGKALTAQIYKRMPLVTYMAGKYGEKGMLRGAGTFNVVGRDQYELVEQGGAGEQDYRVDIHKSENTVHKTLGLRDTMPNSLGSSGQDQEYTQALHRYHHYTSELKIWRSSVEAAMQSSSRKAALASNFQREMESAMVSHLKLFNAKLYRGGPTNASADRWDGLGGVTLACSDTLPYANVARNSTTYFDGKFDTTSRRVDGDGSDDTTNANIFTLIDYANIDLGCQDISDGIDLVIVGPANFRKIKRLAQSKNNYQINDEVPEFSKYGIKQECVKYGNVTITYDPYITGDWSTGDSDAGLLAWDGLATLGGQTLPDLSNAANLVYMFNTESWALHTMPGKSFSLTGMNYMGDRPGGEDAFSGFIETAVRLINHQPGANCVFTNVS